MNNLPEGVAMVGLDDPERLHNDIAHAVGEPPIVRAAAAKAEAEAWLEQHKQEREKLQILCAESHLAIEGARRRIASLELEIAEKNNNLQALQSQCEMLRQETSDLRAFFASILAQMRHFEIPLPIRRRIKNGKKDNSLVAPAVEPGLSVGVPEGT